MATYLKQQRDQTLLSVKVVSRSSKNELAGPLGNELKIKIAAPPVDSAANEELVRFLSKICPCPKGNIVIIRGSTSRHKVWPSRELVLTC